MGFAKPIEQYLFGNQIHVFMYLKDIIRGGSSLEMNLYIAAFVFSLHKAEPQRISPNVVNEMVTAVFESPFMIKAHQNKKCTLFTDKVQDKKVKEGSYIERKHLHGGMCAAIFMLQEFVDCIACMGEDCRECMIQKGIEISMKEKVNVTGVPETMMEKNTDE